MPEVDGYEVCKFIKDIPTLHETKVIFLSAKSKESEIEKGYAVGADLYITKPFSTKNLTRQVNDLFQEV
jgi:CheY-like chemotaxis protein